MKLGKLTGLLRKRVLTVTAIGSGAFIVGALVPFWGTFQTTATGSAQPLTPLLMATLPSAGVADFPTTVSNADICISQVMAEAEETGAEGANGAIQNPASMGTSIVPASHLSDLQKVLSPDLLTPLLASEWPTIHELARTARVPIVMYHDILSEPEVFFDLTPEQFEAQLQQIQAAGLTPVSLDQVLQHLRTGKSLPGKPILLTFDDGYAGHFEHVYPLLKQYGVPAVFSVFPGKLDGDIVGRSTLTWEQLKLMAADPLVTIAAHSVTHPPDLRQLSDEELQQEVQLSKDRLEEKLGVPIQYFTYPAGHYDERVAQAVADAGYLAALTMRQFDEQFAGASESLLAIERFGQSNLPMLLEESWGGTPIIAPMVEQVPANQFDFTANIYPQTVESDEVPLAMITGGRPVTIHADSRYQVSEILVGTNAVAAVDGGFFSLEYLDSNVMIGPVLSQSTHTFVPGNTSENPRLNGRPLVLISDSAVEFVPFDATRHNTLGGLKREMPHVSDAFVAAAWLVKNGEAQPASSFGSLFDFDAYRHRAFWGINQQGQPVIGVSQGRVDSVTLGEMLAQAGLRDAVMVDSGASTSLAFEGESLVQYIPRPVPHVVALIPPEEASGPCPLVIPSREDPADLSPQATSTDLM